MVSKTPSFDQLHWTQVVPAPTIPAEVEARHEKLQWILLKLRRAHMGGQVDEPLRSLAADDLIAPGVSYEDPVATSDSLPELQEYNAVSTTISILGRMGRPLMWLGVLNRCGGKK